MLNKSSTKSKVFYGWWVLLACIVGLLVGPGQFAFGSLGLFILPLQNEFSWSRTEISLATTVFTISLIFFMPLVGRLVDKYGAKTILLPAMLTVGLCLAAIPLVLGELWHLYLLFFIIGSLGAAANSLPFMLAISAWFDKHRGFAIGLAMTGSGLGYAAVPPLVQYINQEFGWRYGYYSLAAIIIILAIPFIFLVFRNQPEDMGLLADGKTQPLNEESLQSEMSGMTRNEALRDPNFRTLIFIFSILAFSLFGILLNMVPMLSDRGMAPNNAAFAASLVGMTIMCVRVPIGLLMDRFFAPYVALSCFLLSAIGFGLFASGATDMWVYIAAILIGFSIGAEVDLLGFLASRYFGLRNFGEIYGFLFASMMLGVSLGPPAFAFCFDSLGDYKAILWLSCGSLLLLSIITARLPAYPEFAINENKG